MQRITYNRTNYFASNTLHDGRILTISRQLYPAPEDPLWIVIRPDGTKADMFYKGTDHATISGRAMETPDGKNRICRIRQREPGIRAPGFNTI